MGGCVMKIAIATNGNTLESLVAEEFEQSAFLLIVETDDLSYKVYPNEEHTDGSGLAMTKKVIECDCEALITGSIEQLAFDELALAQVTRFLGANHSAKDVLNLMEAYKLNIIRDYKGGEGMFHEHHHHTCDCGHHEE
jgi:predicted Fe-Mo cluster-binding NifX family protein